MLYVQELYNSRGNHAARMYLNPSVHSLILLYQSTEYHNARFTLRICIVMVYKSDISISVG